MLLPMENMATETAGKPAVPRSRAGAAKGARALGSVASAAREKLRVRERQTAMLVGQIAAQLEDKQPGRIFAVKLTCTRYKSTGMIVFNQRRARAPMNERDADDDSDDDDSDDEGDNGSELDSGPPPKQAAVVSKPAAAAKAAAAGTADAAKRRGGRENAVGSSEGWQQPRRPAKQQPQSKPKDKLPQKADRNAVSARGHAALDGGQLAALANSINQISKEVCPTSTFTVTRQLPIDGKQVQVQLVPTCMAAEALRQYPKVSGERIKHCFLTGNGKELREMLVPIEPMLVETRARSDLEDMGFDMFEKQ
jgi:hypothetical protein